MSIHDKILYIFRFRNGDTREFLLRFDESNLDLLPHNGKEPPQWADLSLYSCPVCPLDPADHRYCPTAAHLGWILDEIQNYNSFDEVTVEVIDAVRSYIKDTSLQDGLGSLMGIVMATGGCPILKPLRPMVRFHLPFATLEEMEFRMVSMYLFAQYLRQQHGDTCDWTLEGLKDIYKKVNDVNRSFSHRVSLASNSEAAKNAIIILDCFAKTVPKSIENMMKDFRTTFAPVLDA
ncbi:MAG TPA: hypothetical protein VN642_17540 [Dongiaceae bacterium]|nr:hypothetical protein [Dongiaceae bacterium]